MYNLYDYDSLKPKSPHESSKEHFFSYDMTPTTETAVRNQLKIAREQYEDRIQSITREVKQIYHEISFILGN